MTIGLKRYNEEFIIGNGTFLGAGTTVRIKKIESVTGPEKPMMDGTSECPIKITAHLEVECHGTLVCRPCSGCGEPAPAPDLDGLWFIMENHDHARLLFAEKESCNNERDRYPAPGWRQHNGELYCGECFHSVQDALKAIKSKRKAAAK